MTRVLVVGRRRPDLAAQADAADLHAGDPLGDEALRARQLAVAQAELGPGVQALDQAGAQQRQRGHGGAARPASDLDDEVGAERAASTMPTSAPAASISMIRSRLNISPTPEDDRDRRATPPTGALPASP